MKFNKETNYNALYALRKMAAEIAYMSIIPADAMENYIYLGFPEYGNKSMDEIIEKCKTVIDMAQDIKAMAIVEGDENHVG